MTDNQQRAAEEPPWGDDEAFGETCRRDARLRDDLANVIAEWMAAPHKPEDWQRNNADDLTADFLPYVHAYEAAAEARGRAEGIDQGRGDMEALERTWRAEERAEVAAKVEALAVKLDDEAQAFGSLKSWEVTAQLRTLAAEVTAPAGRDDTTEDGQ